jgi:hypothetical protein
MRPTASPATLRGAVRGGASQEQGCEEQDAGQASCVQHVQPQCDAMPGGYAVGVTPSSLGPPPPGKDDGMPGT